jgi:hypothetical protein
MLQAKLVAEVSWHWQPVVHLPNSRLVPVMVPLHTSVDWLQSVSEEHWAAQEPMTHFGSLKDVSWQLQL